MRKFMVQVKKVVASLIVLMIVFNHVNILASNLITLAVENSDERITYSASFVVLNGDEELDVSDDEQLSENLSNEEIDDSNEISGESETITQIENEIDEVEEQIQNEEEIPSEEEPKGEANTEDLVEQDEVDSETETENEVEIEEVSTEIVENIEEFTNQVEIDEESENSAEATEESENLAETTEESEEKNVPEGLALQITLGLKTKGYLKNAKVDIKDLANQNFKIRDNVVLSEYVQSIEENKIRFKQINGETEVNVYIPIELKEEEQIDIAKLQAGVELNLTCTDVSEDGEEEIITRTVRPVLELSNDMDLIIESEAEKFIPYITDGRREALVQLRVAIGTTTKNNLPIKDTSIELPLPELEGATIKNVNVQALSTGFTNGKLNGDVIFTAENWNYEDGKVQINVNNPEYNSRYQMNNGDDEYIISYIYENVPEDIENVETEIKATANVFTSYGENLILNSLKKEYDLSHANSNIVTYNVLRRTKEMSKGYLYANANAEETEYIVEYDNSIDINVSRPDLVNAIQINEQEEYFVIDENNKYPTRTEAGENTYYERIRFNKQNLDSIIGEEGNLEILLENGTSLIKIDKNTPDDGDGNLSISFGENRIGRIVIKINNPEGEGILSLVATKAIAEVNFEKIDFSLFKSIEEEFIGLAEIEEGLVTELGNQKIETELKETSTNAQISLSRSDISTLVENEDVGITITLNNGTEKSDMYKNPVFEIVFPSEVEEVTLKDMNLLYGNDELEISNLEILRNELNQVVLRVTLEGTQTKYATGDQAIGTSILLKVDIKTNIYSASKQEQLEMNYYNEDATNYATESDWKLIQDISSYMLITKQGKASTKLNIVAPEGLVNAQMITDYKENGKVISVNQGRKEDTIATFGDSQNAKMQMLVINNTDEDLETTHILGRTIFNGNKSIITNEELGTNYTAPMTSLITAENQEYNQKIYYSENGDATDDLENQENGWVETPETLENVKSFLIVIDGKIEARSILGYSYNFQIPEKLNNNIELAGTFGTIYNGTKTNGKVEADKVVLTTGDAPALKVETLSDLSETSVVEGQLVTYTVRVTNEGRSISTNTVVNSIIPAGTTYVQDDGELNPNVTELKINMGDINPGKTEEISYQVKVNSNASEQKSIETANNVEADGLEEPIYTEVPETPIDTAEVEILVDNEIPGEVIKQGSMMWYTINVLNYGYEIIDDCTVTMQLPDGLKFDEAYIIGVNEEGYETSMGGASYDEGSRQVTWRFNGLDDSVSLKLKSTTMNISEAQKEIATSATISSPNMKRSYTSEEIRNTIAKPVIEYTYKTSINNQFIKEGDYIDYILDVKNTGLVGNENILISNSIPENFRVVGGNIIKEDSAFSILPTQNAEFNVNLASSESAQIVLTCVANNLDDVNNNVSTQNSWTISGEGMDTIRTKSIQNIVQQNYDLPQANTNQEYVTIDSVANQEEQPVQQQTQEQTEKIAQQPQLTINEKTEENVDINVFKIMGVAFNDLNNNGEFDDDELGMAKIVAKLCDAKTQKIVAQTSTNNAGEYLFDNIAPGEYYVKYEYDNTKYSLSEYKKQGVLPSKNSDAIISNYKAITDKIIVTDKSVSDINIGLVRAGIFDLSLDVNVNQITVQNNKETINYEMENSKLAKVDIDPKTVPETKIYAQYTIEVENKGEIAGYAKRIVDYIPEEFELDTTLNPNWYKGADGSVYTDELEDTIINPGESKILTLVLTKQMTDSSTGLINNTFEIAKSYNEYAIEDIDSAVANKAEGEDDMSRVDLIIGIQTGESAINVMIISATLITLLIALYVIKVYADRKNKEVIL